MRSIKHAAVAVALTAVLASCSDDTGSGPDTKTKESETPSAGATECQSPVGREGELTPGCWTIELAGGPRAELDLPAGFFGSDWGVWVDPPKPEDWGNISLGTSGDVYRDPCHRVGGARKVGPTAEDFTRALGAQKLTDMTAPVPVEVDGHAGLYVELSVPAAVDISRCPHQELALWLDPDGETAGISHDFMSRFWVLEMDGQLVLFVVNTQPNATDAAVARFSRIVESATLAEG